MCSTKRELTFKCRIYRYRLLFGQQHGVEIKKEEPGFILLNFQCKIGSL